MSITFDTAMHATLAETVAQKMVIAARTAPKARGKDTLIAAVVDTETREAIAAHMRNMVEKKQAAAFFLRDADNLEASDALVLLGTKIDPMRLQPCSLCGFAHCEEKEKYPNHPCAFNTGDLGIAIGSAVSVAMDSRIDNRIMFSIGMAVTDMNLLGEDVRIVYGIPLSITGKNLFFDRKPKS